MKTKTIEMKGVKSPFSIIRDKYSVPYIKAETEEDAWFGLGFAQGQDRAFQLEYYKRQANGELAGIFGEKFLNADRYMRIIGLKRIAKEYIKVQDERQYAILEAFTAGVNAGLIDENAERDAAFKILACEPTSYEMADVISTQLYFSLSLTHWLGKLTRFLLLEKLPPETVNKLDPPYASYNYMIKPVGCKAGEDDGELYKELAAMKKLLNTKGASNNWCLNGKRTKSGKPLVANDPHLAADVPAPWYFASVSAPGFKICGAFYPGSTICFNGHNGNVAWAMTAAFIDNVDLYKEKLNETGNATLADGEYIPCKVVEEKIDVKNKDAFVEKVLIGKHGPILSPAMKNCDHVISMCATWFKPKPMNGFMLIQDAKDIYDVKKFFKDWSFCSTNLVMADIKGNICWQLCGEIPNRKKTKGMLPMPGWDSSYDWEDEIIDYSKNPSIINPPEDFLATANNKHTSMIDDPYTGRDFIDGYRHRRVVTLLKSKEKWDLEETKAMQQDRYSGPWEDIKDAVLAINSENEECKKALSLLTNWDGVMRPESMETTLYAFFIAELTKRIISEIAPGFEEMIYETYNPAVGSACFAMSRISQILQLVNQQPSDMFGGDWNAFLSEALGNAYDMMQTTTSLFSNTKEWGNYRPLLLKHPINRNIPDYDVEKYNKILNLGPVTWGGDEQTLNVAAGSPLDPRVTPDFIPNMRSVMNVGDWENNYFSLAGGQSSNPTSDHYGDLFDLWKEGKGIRIAWDDKEIASIGIEKIEIKPN